MPPTTETRAYAGCHAVVRVRADLIELLLRTGLSVAELASIADAASVNKMSERTLQRHLCLNAMLVGGISAATDLPVSKLTDMQWLVYALAEDPRYTINKGITDRRFVCRNSEDGLSRDERIDLEFDEAKVTLARFCFERGARKRAGEVRIQGRRLDVYVADVIEAYFVDQYVKRNGEEAFRLAALTETIAHRAAFGGYYRPGPRDVRSALGLYFKTVGERFLNRAPFDAKKFRRRWDARPYVSGPLTKLPRKKWPQHYWGFDRKMYEMHERWVDEETRRLKLLLCHYKSVHRSITALKREGAGKRSRAALSDSELRVARSFFRRDLRTTFE